MHLSVKNVALILFSYNLLHSQTYIFLSYAIFSVWKKTHIYIENYSPKICLRFIYPYFRSELDTEVRLCWLTNYNQLFSIRCCWMLSMTTQLYRCWRQRRHRSSCGDSCFLLITGMCLFFGMIYVYRMCGEKKTQQSWCLLGKGKGFALGKQEK